MAITLRNRSISAFVHSEDDLHFATMKGVLRHGGILRLGVLAVWLLSAVSVRADGNTGPGPVEEAIPTSEVGKCDCPPDVEACLTIAVIAYIAVMIVVEAFCVSAILSAARRPRRFILWLVGMCFVTRALGFGWLLLDLCGFYVLAVRFYILAVLSGEVFILLANGILAYQICLRAPAQHPERPLPSFRRCLAASLLGNFVFYAPFLVFLGIAIFQSK